MNTLDRTLNTFFCCSGQELTEEKARSVERQLQEEGRQLPQPGLIEGAGSWLAELLDIRMDDILAGAWNQLRTLQKYLDRKKYPPEKVVLVPLAEHTIKSRHRPFIEILLNEAPVGKLEFQVDLALKLQGVTLKIQDGRIKEAFTGTCAGRGTLACEHILLLEKETQAIPLPGSVKFGEGIPIPGPGSSS